MLRVDHYTAQYDSAMRPTAPRVGSFVRLAYEPDARELFAFKEVLRLNGLDTQHVRTMPRARQDVYRVVRAGRG